MGKLRKFLYNNVLYICFFSTVALLSCSHNRLAVEEPKAGAPGMVSSPSITVLHETIARLEKLLSQREDELTTLNRRLERIIEQRDAYAGQLEQAGEELNKLREENEVLNKKIEEILALKPAAPPAKVDIYIVQLGDTLESIAARDDVYGDRSRWKEIYEENKDVIGSAPDNLVEGTKLIIPRP